MHARISGARSLTERRWLAERDEHGAHLPTVIAPARMFGSNSRPRVTEHGRVYDRALSADTRRKIVAILLGIVAPLQ